MERSYAKYDRPQVKNDREQLTPRLRSRHPVYQYNDFWTALDQLRGIKTRLHHWHFSLGTAYLSFLRFVKIWKFWPQKMPLHTEPKSQNEQEMSRKRPLEIFISSQYCLAEIFPLCIQFSCWDLARPQKGDWEGEMRWHSTFLAEA